ncbi:MAG: hypothetical protein ACC608_03045 [Anaerofustis sp.]
MLTLELSLFEAYYILDITDKKLFKGLKFKNNYLSEIYIGRQNFVEKNDLDNINKCYKSYISKLTQSGKKATIGAIATVGVTIATAGVASVLAPSIAIFLVGDTVAAGLSGAALTSASLAAIGGGSLATGGLGMAGGTAILTGGGAMLGLTGSGSASFISFMGKTSEQYTLNECAKLLTFCKLDLVEKFNKAELLNPIILGVENCINYIKDTSKNAIETKESTKRIKSSLKYLEKCLKELYKLAQTEKKQSNGANAQLSSKVK